MRSTVARQLRKDLPWLMMSAPSLLLLLLFAYVPLYGIIIAFKDYRANRGVLGSVWVGLKNFEFLFTTDTAFRITRNTVLLNLAFILVGTVASLFLAFLLYELYGSLAVKFYQSSMFAPSYISWVIVGYFVYAFLNTNQGIANRLLTQLGIISDPLRWYGTPNVWPAILVLVSIWKGAGAGSVVYLAGMLSINPEYYEAAAIDGASRWQQRWYITLPLLRPMIMVMLLLSLRSIFSADFGMFYFVTQNNPQLYATTDVIDTFVFRALRSLGNAGMAAAAGLYQATVGFVIVMFVNWIIRRIDPDYALF